MDAGLYLILFFVGTGLSDGASLKNTPSFSVLPSDCLYYNPANVSYVFDTADTDTLVSVNVIHRHGARSPTAFFPTDIFAAQNKTLWPNGIGMLTDEGKRLASQLGRYVRVRYDNFLAQNYTDKEVFVQCSDVPRAIETVTLMLETLFTLPNCTSPIPVNIIQAKNDNKIQMRAQCNLSSALHDEYMASKAVQDFYKKTQATKLFQELTKQTGSTINTAAGVGNFGDTLWSECQRGLSGQFAAWMKKYYPTQTQPFRDFDFNSYTATPKLARLEVGGLFSEMIQSFKVAIGSATSWSPMLQKNVQMKQSKLYIYSAHEATIYAFLNALSLFKTQVSPQAPLYTSAIFFELHCPDQAKCKKNPKNEENYVIQAFYKQRKDTQAQHLVLDECPGTSGDCTLKGFQKSYKHLIFKNTETRSQTEAWTEACTIPSKGC